MSTLCIVPCGKKKIWDKNPHAGPTAAGDVYIGPFARKCRDYAKLFYPSAWCILSAKYGFLLPDDIVQGPYNISFNDKRANSITIQELTKQAQEKGLDKYQMIVVLGGSHYRDIVRAIFMKKEIAYPLQDCPGLGYMLQKLKEAINRFEKL